MISIKIIETRSDSTFKLIFKQSTYIKNCCLHFNGAEKVNDQFTLVVYFLGSPGVILVLH